MTICCVGGNHLDEMGSIRTPTHCAKFAMAGRMILMGDRDSRRALFPNSHFSFLS